MDGILEPNDAQDISKKIEESEFASGLVHRIRDVMRRLRLGAPSLTDREPGLDPNTVSEYLDNTLPNDRVADFEKVCLESDVHLAEVASCHQVLTLVLGEPAEIDPKSRQSMYQLQEIQATSHMSGSADGPVTRVTTDLPALRSGSDDSAKPVMVGGPIDDEDEQKAHPKPTIPEYLRERTTNSTYSWLLGAVLLLVCVVAVILYYGDGLVRLGLIEAPREVAVAPAGHAPVTGPRDGDAGPPSVLGEGTKSAVAPSPQNGSSEPAASVGAESEKPSTEKATAAPKSPTPTATPTESAVGQPPAAAPDKTVEQGVSKEVGKEPPKIVAPPPAVAIPPKPEPPPERRANVEAPGKAIAKGEPKSSLSAPVTGTQPTTSPSEPASGKSTAAPDAQPAAPPAAGSGAPAKPGTAAEKPIEAAAPPRESLGMLMSSTDQVLLKYSTASGWTRVAPDQILTTERLLALPTYRAKISLNIGVVLEILGGTQLDFLGSSTQETPGIRIAFGRVVMRPPGKAGMQLRVAFGDRSGMLQFNDAESVAALEVRRTHMPGMNPETEPTHMVAELFAALGNLSWSEGTPPTSIHLAPASRLRLDAQSTVGPLPTKEIPQWTKPELLNAWDRLASAPMAQGLQSEQTARLGLTKMAEHRQKEIRWLALRSLGYLGEYQDIMPVLAEPASKTVWTDYVEYLRDAVARDRESAAAVHTALERQYPEGADLYRMLWGYTNEELIGKDPEHAEDANLVEALNSDSLAMRRLGFWNLKDITNYSLTYRPEDTAARRQQAYQAWRARLEGKQIRIKPVEEKKLPVARAKPAKPPVAEAETP
jgi:hypothetical protein